jgi:hypothetical protein
MSVISKPYTGNDEIMLNAHRLGMTEMASPPGAVIGCRLTPGCG